jgi:hypothetical protein
MVALRHGPCRESRLSSDASNGRCFLLTGCAALRKRTKVLLAQGKEMRETCNGGILFWMV